MRARFAALLLPWLTSFAASQVVINEIGFTPAGNDGQWIELFNIGPNAADLGTWSVYQATKTTGRAQNYWFGFPTGTVLEQGRFLRVHWLAALQGDNAGNIYTGRENLNFLFGLGAEPLDKAGGAIGLFTTKENARMNDSAVIHDWVQWGGTGWRRENLAIANRRWESGTFVPGVPGIESIAFMNYLQEEPTKATSFFRDRSPTPPLFAPYDNGHNFPLAVLAPPYGFSCTTGPIPVPNMELVSIPTLGNIDFGWRASPVTSNSVGFLIIANARGNGSVFIGACEFWLSVASLPLVLIAPNSGGKCFAGFVPEDPALFQLEVHSQWIIADLPTLAIGTTGAAQFQFGG